MLLFVALGLDFIEMILGVGPSHTCDSLKDARSNALRAMLIDSMTQLDVSVAKAVH